jgi:hypothetical protein
VDLSLRGVARGLVEVWNHIESAVADAVVAAGGARDGNPLHEAPAARDAGDYIPREPEDATTTRQTTPSPA